MRKYLQLWPRRVGRARRAIWETLAEKRKPPTVELRAPQRSQTSTLSPAFIFFCHMQHDESSDRQPTA